MSAAPAQTISEPDWRKVRKTLLPNVDPERMRAELEELRQGWLVDPEKQARECEARAQAYDAALAVTRDAEGQLIALLTRLSAEAKTEAKAWRKRKPKRPRFLYQFLLMFLWERTSGRTIPIHGRGAHADFLKAAVTAVFDKEKPLGSSQIKHLAEQYWKMKRNPRELLALARRTLELTTDGSKVGILKPDGSVCWPDEKKVAV